jgi:multiple antibiotic resistance protein
MDSGVVHFGTVLVAFFAIMNPIANAPAFVALTEGMEPDIRRQIALRAVVVAFCIVAGFAIGGRTIFDLFGITLPAFRIAGGGLVGLVGYHMLQGRMSSVSAPREGDAEESADAALSIAVTPLALPMLAGPGTIATAMNFASESTIPEIVRVLVAFGLVCVVTWAAFVAGPSLTRFLGKNAIDVVTRLMGLILSVVGVQMLITGIRGAIALPAG